MSDGIKKYILISSSILLILLCVGICWLFNFIPYITITFSYIIGICNGLLMLEISNYE